MRNLTLKNKCLVREITLSAAPNGDGKVITISVCREDNVALEVVAYENNTKHCFVEMKRLKDRAELVEGAVIDVKGMITKNEKSGDDYMLCERIEISTEVAEQAQQQTIIFGRNKALNIRGRRSSGEKLSDSDEKWCKKIAQNYIILSNTDKGIQLAKQGVTTSLDRISRCRFVFLGPPISQYEAYLVEHEVLGCLRTRDGSSMFGVASDLGLTLTDIEGGESETFYNSHMNIVSLEIMECLNRRFGPLWRESV